MVIPVRRFTLNYVDRSYPTCVGVDSFSRCFEKEESLGYRRSALRLSAIPRLHLSLRRDYCRLVLLKSPEPCHCSGHLVLRNGSSMSRKKTSGSYQPLGTRTLSRIMGVLDSETWSGFSARPTQCPTTRDPAGLQHDLSKIRDSASRDSA